MGLERRNLEPGIGLGYGFSWINCMSFDIFIITRKFQTPVSYAQALFIRIMNPDHALIGLASDLCNHVSSLLSAVSRFTASDRTGPHRRTG